MFDGVSSAVKSMRLKVSFMGWMICWCDWSSLLPLLDTLGRLSPCQQSARLLQRICSEYSVMSSSWCKSGVKDTKMKIRTLCFHLPVVYVGLYAMEYHGLISCWALQVFGCSESRVKPSKPRSAVENHMMTVSVTSLVLWHNFQNQHTCMLHGTPAVGQTLPWCHHSKATRLHVGSCVMAWD